MYEDFSENHLKKIEDKIKNNDYTSYFQFQKEFQIYKDNFNVNNF